MNLQESGNEPAVAAAGLGYKAGFTPLLRKIEFELRTGEVLALLGPNGAGKSTLLKCLAGILPYSGKRTLMGASTRNDVATRRHIGYLGHESFLYQKLSARENLIFYSQLYSVAIDPDSLLREYGLGFAGDQFVETFSRGMKQRLALARALLHSPKILLLDEPFTGMDQEATEMLESRIRGLRGTTTIVIATHELDRAAQMADRFLILKNGQQVFFGTKSSVSMPLSDLYRSLVSVKDSA